MSTPAFDLEDRVRTLRTAADERYDLVVVGGGITGAGVLRDAAMRGLRALLIERGDFASGTSCATSKMIHGGLRYLAQGQLSVVRLSSRERDLLAALNPNLVRPLPFLLCSVRGGLPPWKLRVALRLYDLLAGSASHERSRYVSAEEAIGICPALGGAGVREAALYWDQQADDARIVLETIKSARRHGARAVSYAEAVAVPRDAQGRVTGVRVRDRLGGGEVDLAASIVVNAAGPGAARVRALATGGPASLVRPAKGVHVVVSRERFPCAAAVAFEAHDGRHMFVVPFDDVVMIGTTDTFTLEIDDPSPTIGDRDYLLRAANHAFPAASLAPSDVESAFAGVRPLVASPDDTRSPSKLSREHRVDEDVPGLITVAGGKLTTYRAMAEEIVDLAARRIARERGTRPGPCRTALEPLREDAFDAVELEGLLRARYGLSAHRAEHLVRAWGADAERVLEEAAPAWREPIGRSR